MSNKARFSFANLAVQLISDDGETFLLGVKRKNMIAALGGAVELTPEGEEIFRLKFGASDFEVDKHTGLTDARFLVDVSDLERVFCFFEENLGRRDRRYEKDPLRDIRAELCGEEESGVAPILPKNLLGDISFHHSMVIRQQPPESGTGTSQREKAGIPNRRLFRLWNIYGTNPAISAIVKSPSVYILSHEELATTKGGACKGVTNDGTPIADNLFELPLG